MSYPEDEGLDEVLELFEKIDEETHYWGKDRTSSCMLGKTYDVDYINPKRVLIGSEAATIYMGVKKYEELTMDEAILEEPRGARTRLVDGKRMVSPGENFTPGYRILMEERDPEPVLTFAEKQLPDSYKDMFAELFESNKRES
jgi:hypothetical protein